jgi:hypothetical protein
MLWVLLWGQDVIEDYFLGHYLSSIISLGTILLDIIFMDTVSLVTITLCTV